MRPRPHRRSLLRSLGGTSVPAVLAGCTLGSPTDPDRPIYVRNETDDERAVTVTVWNDETDETHFAESFDLEAGEGVRPTVHLAKTATYGLRAASGDERAESVREANPRDGASFRVRLYDREIEASIYYKH